MVNKTKRLLFIGQETTPPFLAGEEQMEFYIFRVDGEISRISNMFKDFERVRVFAFENSPDQMYIAFWATFNNENIPKLALFEINSGRVIITCIESGSGSLENIYWSSSSEYILLLHNGIVITINIKTMQTYKIIKDYTPLGWVLK